MKTKPFRWDVVIAGYWNRAILTPNGIAKRLFKLPKGTGIEVFIPVDALESPQVKHEGIVVKVEERRLIIATEKPSYESLNKAMQTGCNALQDLPETPVLAAGFNVRFAIEDYPHEFEEIIQSGIDTHLSDAGYEIVSRGLTRKIRFKDGIFEKGILNLYAHRGEDSLIKIELNFHRDSKETKDLTDWLNVSAVDLETEIMAILKNSSLNLEETEDE